MSEPRNKSYGINSKGMLKRQASAPGGGLFGPKLVNVLERILES